MKIGIFKFRKQNKDIESYNIKDIAEMLAEGFHEIEFKNAQLTGTGFFDHVARIYRNTPAEIEVIECKIEKLTRSKTEHSKTEDQIDQIDDEMENLEMKKQDLISGKKYFIQKIKRLAKSGDTKVQEKLKELGFTDIDKSFILGDSELVKEFV